MKRHYLLIIFMILLSWASKAQRTDVPMSELTFVENKKQWDAKVLYRAEILQGVVFLEKDAFTFVVYEKSKHHKRSQNHNSFDAKEDAVHKKRHAYRMNFVGANSTNLKGSDTTSDYYNYFIGNDESKWASHVKGFRVVEYKDIYPEIDMKVYSRNDLFKYDLIVKPNARPENIKIQYEGVDALRTKGDELVVYTSAGEIVELKPFAYQIINDRQMEIPCHYVLRGNELSFSLGDYNSAYELIIDPTLVFSTYTGSYADNWGFTATYDSKGNAFAGGIAFAEGYPVSMGAFQKNYAGGKCDMAIMMFDSTGTKRIYATYLGGNSSEMPHSMMVNEFNELLILGTTGSSDYPTTSNAYSRIFRGGTAVEDYISLRFLSGTDMVVSKLNADGSQLLASTFIGGSDNDGLNFRPSYDDFGNDSLYYNYGDGARGELITDDLNNVYVGSCTFSSDFPTTSNAFQQTSKGKQEGVVFKLDYNLSNLIWSSYIGGKGDDAIYSIDVDSKYDLYVTGGTNSSNFPTTKGAYQTTYAGGSVDAFVSKISKNGSKLLASTLYGTNQYDQSYFVRSDRFDNIYITGQTKAKGSTLIKNALYNTPNSGQFIAKFNSDLTETYWSTVYGTGTGQPNIAPTAFSVDICERIYVAGWGRVFDPWGNKTVGTNNMQITSDAYQKTTDGQDFYVMILKPNASALSYATYFGELHNINNNDRGADHVDGGTSRFDKKACIYQSVCASCAKGKNFPGGQGFPTYPSNAFSTSNNSHNCNNALFKIKVETDFALADFATPNIECAPVTIKFENNSIGTNFIWDFGDGSPKSTDKNPSHAYTQGGWYPVTLIALLPSGCRLADTLVKNVLVLSNRKDTLSTIPLCKNEQKQIGVPPVNDPQVTYQWSPAAGLSDTQVPNPFASPNTSTWYRLVISNNTCNDTVYQLVKVYDLTQINIPDTILCVNKIRLNDLLPSQDPYLQYIWSLKSDFSQPIDGNVVYILDKPSLMFYVKISLDDCEYIDSVRVSLEFSDCDVQIQNISCYGNADGSILLEPHSIPPYTYWWNDGSTSQNRTNLASGTYIVNITNGEGCIYANTFVIEMPPQLVLNKNIQNSLCEELCTGFINLNVIGGTPPYSYLWSNGANTSSISDLCPDIYTVKITDSNGCTLFDTTQIIEEDIFANIQVWADKDTIFLGLSTVLHATYIDGLSYEWDNIATLSNPYSSTTLASPTTTTTYQLTVRHSSGCQKVYTITIHVIYILCDEPFIFIPNAFTPNGDNQNDKVFVRSQFIDKLDFSIYDRWGEKVFETHDINIGWDGTFRGRYCQPGVYVYQVQATCLDGKTYTKKGDITLIQ